MLLVSSLPAAHRQRDLDSELVKVGEFPERVGRPCGEIARRDPTIGVDVQHGEQLPEGLVADKVANELRELMVLKEPTPVDKSGQKRRDWRGVVGIPIVPVGVLFILIGEKQSGQRAC